MGSRESAKEVLQPCGTLDGWIVTLHCKGSVTTSSNTVNPEELSKIRWILQPSYSHPHSNWNNLALFLSTNEFGIGYPLEGVFEVRFYYSRTAPVYSHSKSPSKFVVGVGGNALFVEQNQSSSDNSHHNHHNHNFSNMQHHHPHTNNYHHHLNLDACIQLNGHLYHCMNTITMSYNLKAETVGKIVKLQPSVGEFGIIAYVKREQDELKFVKGMQPLIINSYGAQNISDHQKLDNLIYLASEKEKASLTQMPQLQQQQQKLSQLKHKTYAINGNSIIIWIPNKYGMVEYFRTPPADWIIPEDLKQRITGLVLLLVLVLLVLLLVLLVLVLLVLVLLVLLVLVVVDSIRFVFFQVSQLFFFFFFFFKFML